MVTIITFAGMLTVVGIGALWVGRGPERVAALFMAIAFAASAALPYTPQNTFGGFFAQMFEVDAGLFVGLLAIAILANRYWPLWLAGLQLLTLGIHLAKAFEPAILPIVYARASERIGYLMLALLAVGIWRLRARRRVFGVERDWVRHSLPQPMVPHEIHQEI